MSFVRPQTIWKFPIEITDIQTIIAQDARINKVLSVGLDPNGIPCVWALVDPSYPRSSCVDISVIGTGNPVRTNSEFVGSFVLGHFVWHVFAQPPYVPLAGS